MTFLPPLSFIILSGIFVINMFKNRLISTLVYLWDEVNLFDGFYGLLESAFVDGSVGSLNYSKIAL